MQNDTLIKALTNEYAEKLLDTFHAACERAGISYYGNYVSYEDAKWTLLMIAFGHYRWSSSTQCEYRDRPNNGKWEIVGYQTANLPRLPFVGQHGCRSSRKDLPDINFNQFKFMHGNIYPQTPEYLSHEEGYALKLVAEGKWQECDKPTLVKLVDYGYVRAEENEYVPNILIFESYGSDKYWNALSKNVQAEIDKLSERLKELFEEVFTYSNTVTKNDLPTRFREDKNLCALACQNTGLDRSDVLEQAIKDGRIKHDEQTSKGIGAYLIV